jgi:predicted metalloprotease
VIHTTHRSLKAVLATTVTTIVAAGLALLPASAATAATSTTPTMPAFLETELLDVHEFWSRFQAGVGGPATDVDYYFPAPGEVVSTPCQVSNDDSMFYCPLNDEIVFSQDAAIRLWNGQFTANHDNHTGQVAGDFAVALIVAHEYAHNVQYEVGIDQLGYKVINTELHADCWAGVWMNDSFYAGELQGTDVEEAVAAMERLGDYQYTNPGTHGTPQQRAYAFQYGYDAGVPAACDAILTQPWL